MNQLQLSFVDKLPNKPYCTDDLHRGLYRKIKDKALNTQYIQMNTTNLKSIITLDVDHSQIQNPYWWKEKSVPAPNYQTMNYDNGHSQIGFILDKGVCTSVNGSYKAKNYYQNVQYGLNQLFDGDWSYRGFTGRNPLNESNNTIYPRGELYDLQELVEYIPEIKPNTKVIEYGEGRNCTIFDNLRHWAYRNMTVEYKHDRRAWRDLLEHKGIELNKQLEVPLWLPELKGIVKSVSSWTYDNVVPTDTYIAITHTTELQNKRRIKGLKKRQEKALQKKIHLMETYSMFPDSTYAELADMEGIPYKTVEKYMREFKKSPIYLNQDNDVIRAYIKELRGGE